MKPCNYCAKEKPLSDYLMTQAGYLRHTCTRCYADYINDTAGYDENRYDRLMETKWAKHGQV